MPAIRLTASECYTFFIFSIALNSKIINPYSYCVKKGLVYITITDLSSCQPFSCSKYTKLNTRVLYNVHSVFFNKCIFLTYLASL